MKGTQIKSGQCLEKRIYSIEAISACIPGTFCHHRDYNTKNLESRDPGDGKWRIKIHAFNFNVFNLNFKKFNVKVKNVHSYYEKPDDNKKISWIIISVLWKSHHRDYIAGKMAGISVLEDLVTIYDNDHNTS